MADLGLISFGNFTVDTGTNELLLTAHGVFDGNLVRVSSSGTLPGGLAAGTDYWVVGSTASADRFQVALTPGGAAVDITSSGSGTHTAFRVVTTFVGDQVKFQQQSLAWFFGGVFRGDLVFGKTLTGTEFTLGFVSLNGIAFGIFPVSPPWRLRSMHIDTLYHAIGGRDNTDGFPGQPSLKLLGKGYFPFRWVIRPGLRSVSARVKQALNESPRPSIVIKANPLVGLSGDIEVFAPLGTDWVTVGPATFTATAEGGVYVELRANHDGQMVPSSWDNLLGS